MTEKILVLITPQFNAQKLIDEGLKLSAKDNGELHILYVKKGNNIFAQGETGRLLQEIFEYAGEKGGIVHFGCGQDIRAEMIGFMMSENITKVVMGESPITKRLAHKNLAEDIKTGLNMLGKEIQISVIEKEESEIYKAI